jgi:ABC-type lipoprotein export system ATPase subunit
VSEAIIDLVDVTRTYDLGRVQVHALAGASLRVEDGEFVAILGPSGSGKSTLMNILGCLDWPTSGRCVLGGTPVEQLGDEKLAAIRSRMIGFVFQSYNLLARARALVTEPRLLLADEPTGNLDTTSGKDVMAVLHDLHASGRTIVLITHDADVAASADREIRVRDGRIAA